MKGVKGFQKGNKINLGRKRPIRSDDWKNKIGSKNKGKKRSEEAILKMKIRATGNKHNLGKKWSSEKRNKLSGKNASNWKGGISKKLYPQHFNNELRLKIRTRDNFQCCLCGISEDESKIRYKRVLTVNHIDFNKNNCSEENLNTLCCKCNSLVNFDRNKWTSYFNNQLQLKIIVEKFKGRE